MKNSSDVIPSCVSVNTLLLVGGGAPEGVYCILGRSAGIMATFELPEYPQNVFVGMVLQNTKLLMMKVWWKKKKV